MRARRTRPAPAFDLDGTGDHQLTLVAAPVTTGDGVLLGPMIDCGFVDLHQAGQGLAFGIGHGAAELGSEQPGRLVGAEAELPPKLKGRDAIGMGGHSPTAATTGHNSWTKPTSSTSSSRSSAA